MSRGFRDADATQDMSGREAEAAIRLVHTEEEEQARHAAERRDQGAYGICESCGGAIGPERLAAVPLATRCMSCQVAWESTRS